MSTIFTGEQWTIQRFISGFANNAFLITCARTNKSVIVDTPANPVELIAAAQATTVEAILITHGHWDHLEGFTKVTNEFSAPVGIGIDDQPSLPAPVTTKPMIDVSTNALVQVGDIPLRAMATPGHTPGSTCFMLAGAGPAAKSPEKSHVFTGDTLFPGGPGKSASHDALKQILNSLDTHIFTLPESTTVLPGHGEFTTIAESKREYAIFNSKPLDPDLSGDVAWV